MRLKLFELFVDRYRSFVLDRRWLVAQSEELAEVEARSDTEVEAENVPPRLWVGPCGTRSSMPEAGSLFPAATPLGLAPDILLAGPPISGYRRGNQAMWEREAFGEWPDDGWTRW